ncbi:hypothetical protein [Ciceribacter sp. L1K22]|uniref:hypothetical protein n=1 Tax=Ciceribacter sp. L1K22 TaxID=2820275 RepID=UPI001ABEDE19|nr:hypothetical protein [Ciceribacter sp. L1K22]MBO3759634.1 hypothetical protein [Ciceribacter sp. L1K22]
MTSITSLPGSASLNSTLGLDRNGDGVVSAEEQAAAGETRGRTQDPTVLVENAATGTSAKISSLSVANPLATGAESGDDTVSLFDVLDQIAVIVDRYRTFEETGGDASGEVSFNL